MYKGTEHELKLTEDELLVLRAGVNTQQGSLQMNRRALKCNNSAAALVISVEEMYAATVDGREPRRFHVHVLAAVAAKKREAMDVAFTCRTAEQASTWVDVLRHVIIGAPLSGQLRTVQDGIESFVHSIIITLSHILTVLFTVFADPLPVRRALVLLNPFSGRKKAPGIWRRAVQPMLDRSTLQYDFIQACMEAFSAMAVIILFPDGAAPACAGRGAADRPGPLLRAGHHQRRRADARGLHQPDGRVMTLGQAVQGLMRHADVARAIALPLAFIPAGTGNGIAVSMGIWGVCALVYIASNCLTFAVTASAFQSAARRRARHAEPHQVPPATARSLLLSARGRAPGVLLPDAHLGRHLRH